MVAPLMRQALFFCLLAVLGPLSSAFAQVTEVKFVSATKPELLRSWPKEWRQGFFYDEWTQLCQYRETRTIQTRTRTLVTRTQTVTAGLTVKRPAPSVNAGVTISDTYSFTPWVTQTFTRTFFVIEKGGIWRPFLTPPTIPLTASDQMTVTASDTWINDWDLGSGTNFTTVTFDGVVIPAGGEIDFGDYPHGDHSLVVSAPNRRIDYTVTIAPECTLERTSIPYGERISKVSPFGRATFTNHSDRTIEAVPIASYDTAVYTGLDLTVSPAKVTLTPGESVEFDLAFATDPGFVFPLAEPVTGRLDVFEVEEVDVPNGVPHASIELDAAPGFAQAGTREDLVLHLSVEAGDDEHIPARYADLGDQMTLMVDSPGGGFVGTGYVLYGALGLDETTAFVHTAGLPSVHLGQSPIQLASGMIGAGDAPVVLPHADPALVGTPIRFQAISFGAHAANGSYGATEAMDVFLR